MPNARARRKDRRKLAHSIAVGMTGRHTPELDRLTIASRHTHEGLNQFVREGKGRQTLIYRINGESCYRITSRTTRRDRYSAYQKPGAHARMVYAP